MWKFKSERLARERAFETGLLYGLCVLNGFWYVGTAEQLAKIACLSSPCPEVKGETDEPR
jgi:hypothetical protein